MIIAANMVTGNVSPGTVGIQLGYIPSAEIHANYVSGVVTPYQYIGGRISDVTHTFATLPGAPLDGSEVYCATCGIGVNSVCVAGGGAFAKRIAGQWRCN